MQIYTVCFNKHSGSSLGNTIPKAKQCWALLDLEWETVQVLSDHFYQLKGTYGGRLIDPCPANPGVEDDEQVIVNTGWSPFTPEFWGVCVSQGGIVNRSNLIQPLTVALRLDQALEDLKATARLCMKHLVDLSLYFLHAQHKKCAQQL